MVRTIGVHFAAFGSKRNTMILLSLTFLIGTVLIIIYNLTTTADYERMLDDNPWIPILT